MKLTEPSANVYNIGSVDSLRPSLMHLKIKGCPVQNKMLEYSKTILQKISFSKSLFKKEYKKTYKYLSEGERVELKKWLKANVLEV